MEKYLKTTIATAMMVCLAAARAAGAPALTVGDTAPKLQAAEWIKGQPVDAFRNGRVYVLEFWATWCIPCVAAMPHLSELSRRYRDTVTFVGVHIETSEDKRAQAGKDTDYLANIRRFVRKQGNKLAYAVAVDDPVRYPIGTAWFKAAGLRGIPATVIVDHAGRIAWIGHPEALDRVLPQVLNGTLDLAAAKAQHQAEAVSEDDPAVEFWRVYKRALRAKDYPAAASIAEQFIARNPQVHPLRMTRLKALLGVEESRGVAYARELLSDESFMEGMNGAETPGRAWMEVGVVIGNHEGLSQDAYRYARECLTLALEKQPKSHRAWSSLATAHHHLGEMEKAIDAQRKAVMFAKESQEPGLADLLQAQLERLQQGISTQTHR